MKSFVAGVVVFLGLAGCHHDLNPGRCNSTNDCPSGETCDLSPSANGTCVCNSPSCMDGSSGTGGGAGSGIAGAGGSSGTGGAAGSGADGSTDSGGSCRPGCAAPTAICSNGVCVECASNADCTTATKPVCDMATNSCRGCTADSECPAAPGVCMAHEDGHCATVAETIYIENDTSICSDTVAPTDPGAGTASKPLCSMQPLLTFLSSTRDLVVIRGTVTAGTWNFGGQGAAQTSIVGQQTALLGSVGSPAFSMDIGSVYIRDLEVSSSGSDGIDLSGGTLSLQNVTIAGSATSKVGISASGGTLSLEKVTVDSCKGGGILLSGSAFDIEDTTVTNNGPGTDSSGGSWGGILVNNPPSAGATKLNLVTVENNNGGGVTCSAAVVGADVLVDANVNTPVQVSTACNFSSCAAAGTTCGAQ